MTLHVPKRFNVHSVVMFHSGQLTYLFINRSKVQQITGGTYDPHPRSGNVLPPPADEFNNYSSSGKPSNKIATIVSFLVLIVSNSWVLSIT